MELPKLELLLSGTPCTACGHLYRLTLPKRPTTEGLSFRMGPCSECGHLMSHTADGDLVDLTPAQVAEVKASPHFEKWMQKQQSVVAHLLG